MRQRKSRRDRARFRVGRVSVYLHHGAWWLYFRESDRPVRRRVAETREAAERIAAEVNAQLSAATSTMFAFTPMTIGVLREEFLRYHEQVRRSSVATIRRYRTATQHLVDYVATLKSEVQAHQLAVAGFVGFLRTREVAPNGHANSKRRRLRDKGVQFILETCRSLFAYGTRSRHLPPYFGNPFGDLQLDRMRIEDSKAIFLFDAASELKFLRTAPGMERWLHFILAKTGMRSGELCHLLIEDLDLAGGWLHVRNKTELGWRIKTGNERSIPLIPEVVEVLRCVIGDRTAGPVFLRLKFDVAKSALANRNRQQMAKAVEHRVTQATAASSQELSRQERLKIARTVWRDAGALDPDHVRKSFIKVAAHAGLLGATCPKSWRHSFATLLQDCNIDPLIRQITLGHQPAGGKAALGMTSIYSHSRPEIRACEDEIDRGIVDLVVMEDLARAHRNIQHSTGFVFDAVDHDTRVIATGDGLDTFDENWESILIAAASRHGMTVPEARRRVKRTAKLPEFTPIILEMKRRVERGDSYPMIASWLNAEGIAPGPYVKSGRWSGRLVNSYLRSKLLSGTRSHRDFLHKQIFKTGKFKRTKNPEPERKYYVELAHMSIDEQQALWKVMDARNPKTNKEASHPRKGIARGDTLWPGNHITCGVCDACLYWNSPKLLKCRNTLAGRSTKCWNQVLVNAEQVRLKLIPKILEALSARPDDLNGLVDSAWAEFERTVNVQNRKRSADEKRLKEYQKDAQKLAEAIAKQPLDTLIAELAKTEKEIKKLKTELARDQKQREQEKRFLTREDVVARLPEALLELSRTSFEFDAVMREMFPDFYVQPIQALDTPQIHPRVVLWLPEEPSESPDGPKPLRESITIDAFDAPLHITNAQPCWQVKQDHPDWTLDDIAEHLNLNRMTVKRSLGFQRLMHQHGTTEPYVELTEKPAKASRWKAASQTGGTEPESAGQDAA